jgi:hypothetical protein
MLLLYLESSYLDIDKIAEKIYFNSGKAFS